MLKVFAISTSKVITEAVKVAVGMRYPEFKDKVLGSAPGPPTGS